MSREPDYLATLFVPHMGPGGAQRVAALIANHWVGEGKPVRIVSIWGSPGLTQDLSPRVELEVLTHSKGGGGALGNIVFYIKLVRCLRSRLRRAPSRYLISFTSLTNCLVLLANWGRGGAVVVSERNNPELQRLRQPWRTLRSALYPRADLITANSRAAEEILRSWFPKSRVAYLPNPLEPSPIAGQEAPPEAAAPDDLLSPRFLAVARLVEQKGLREAIRAFAGLVSSGAPGTLDILGDGPLRGDLAALAADLGVEDRVTFHGHVDPAAHYRRAEVFLLPSRFEGTSNALLEAMQAGLPVIVTPAGSDLGAVVEHGREGLVVEAGSVEQLRDAMRQLAKDPEARRAYGEAGRRRVADLSVPKVASRWEQVLLSL